MNKTIKIVIGIIAILIIALLIKIFFFSNTRYALGDFGVSISVPNDFEEKEALSDSNVLLLRDEKKGVTISVTALPMNYWSSGDMNAIMDEYIRLISKAKFECNITEVEGSKLLVNYIEIGKVSMTLEDRKRTNRTVTLLTHETQGNLAIEIYGEPDAIKKNMGMINRIASSIKYSGNSHDYSDFTVSAKTIDT